MFSARRGFFRAVLLPAGGEEENKRSMPVFDRRYTADCRIYNMLAAAPRHLSFHTPGHKEGKWDITELSFSDNLACPAGVLKAAQEDVAKILGAARSFLLTDGSTCGVHAMLYAAGVKKLVFSAAAHKSVYNGCRLLGIEPIVLPVRYAGSVPLQPSPESIAFALQNAGMERGNGSVGVLLTSPDYYGNIADYAAVRRICEACGALLLCDGAHGGHLHGTPLYAGGYCDLWVDGVHKSLPAFTQGAVVSARTEALGARLAAGVDIFRTTSPSYPVLASVEYAVKYPRKLQSERAAERLKERLHARSNADWTKVVVCYGKNAFAVQEALEKQGIYPEFCDGENILFYLSPAQPLRQFKALERALQSFEGLRVNEQNETPMPAFTAGERGGKTEWIPLRESAGHTCAGDAGLFPPCLPVVREGQVIEGEHIEKLSAAKSVYGLIEGKIAVYI